MTKIYNCDKTEELSWLIRLWCEWTEWDIFSLHLSVSYDFLAFKESKSSASKNLDSVSSTWSF